MSGKELRLVQEYFLVACAMGDIMRRFRQQHKNIELLPSKVAIQMNDTHPSLAVAELMRMLMDDHGLAWEQAWEITQQTLAYTNHTLLPEALEKWSVPLLEKVLPRHMQIIFNINHRFLREMQQYSFLDDEKLRKMSIIEEGYEKQVRMAHLCIVGSHSVNGVSALHTELLQDIAGARICAAVAGEVQQQDQRRGAAALADEGQSRADRADQPDARRKQVDHRPATSCAIWSRSPRTRNFAQPSRKSSARTS